MLWMWEYIESSSSKKYWDLLIVNLLEYQFDYLMIYFESLLGWKWCNPYSEVQIFYFKDVSFMEFQLSSWNVYRCFSILTVQNSSDSQCCMSSEISIRFTFSFVAFCLFVLRSYKVVPCMSTSLISVQKLKKTSMQVIWTPSLWIFLP